MTTAAYKPDSEPLDPHQPQGWHQRLRRSVLTVAGARYEGPKTCGERMVALKANRRDPTIYRSGTEVDMTPPGQSAAMIAVEDARVPA
jgi:hypothetical protein